MEQTDDDVVLTVAGLSKENGINYMKEVSHGDLEQVFKLFNDDLYIPADRTGKMTHTYLDDEQTVMITDYTGLETEVYTFSGVHLENVDFTLSISENYGTFLNMVMNGYLFKGVDEIG
jgi:nucleosome binding factor SPN SPT16 subunit